LLALACADAERDEASRVTVRDSAGVEIVEHAGDLWAYAPNWTVADSPSLRIGAVDGDAAYLFTPPSRQPGGLSAAPESAGPRVAG
jgi:hypothetical protein